MYTLEAARREAELNKEIPMLEAQLAHLINRRIEIQAKETANAEYKRKLLARYRLEIKALTEHISNSKTELWGLHELRIAK